MIGELSALAAAGCWAVGSHLFGHIGRGGVPPGAMNMGKCAAGTLLFGITVAATTGRLLPDGPPDALRLLALSGVIGLAFGDTAYFGAIVTIGVRRALLLLSTAPMYAAIGGALFLDEHLGARDVLAIAAVLGGVALVVLDRSGRIAPSRADGHGSTVAADSAADPPAARQTPKMFAVGAALGVISGIAQAAGSLMSRHAMHRGIGAVDASFVRIASGAIGIVALAGALGRLGTWTRPLRRPRTLGAVAASSTVGTFIGIGLAQYAIANAASTAVATTLLATSPIFALPIGHWLGGEPVGKRAIIGTLVACAGLAGLTLQ